MLKEVEGVSAKSVLLALTTCEEMRIFGATLIAFEWSILKFSNKDIQFQHPQPTLN